MAHRVLSISETCSTLRSCRVYLMGHHVLCVFNGSPCVVYLRDLFNAAFVSCWTELSEMQQDELIQSIEQALTVQDIPEITQTLLNLAEFMEHCEKVNLFPLSFISVNI